MMNLLASLPLIGTFVQNISTAFFDAKVKMYQARTCTDRDVAVAAVQTSAIEAHESTAKLAVIAGNRVLLAIVMMLAIPVIAYYWKVVLWDVLWMDGQGNTDPLKGQIADWSNQVVWLIVGAPTSLAGLSMFFNRSK